MYVAPFAETRCRSLVVNLEIDDRCFEETMCTTDDQGQTRILGRDPSSWYESDLLEKSQGLFVLVLPSVLIVTVLVPCPSSMLPRRGELTAISYAVIDELVACSWRRDRTHVSEPIAHGEYA